MEKRFPMKMEETMYEDLRREAFERGISMAALVRSILERYLKRKEVKDGKKRLDS